MTTKRVIFTSDIFRSFGFSLPSVAANRWWLKGLFFDVFRSAGFYVDEFAPTSEGGTFDVEKYRKILDLPQSVDGWTGAVSKRIPVDATALFNGLIDADLVIGWGLTPSIMDLLDRSGVSFIDVEIDPIRFADDLFFRLRTNNRQVLRLLRQLHVGTDELKSSVINIRGYVSRRDPSSVQPGPSLGLFAGQTTVDLSIISSGRIAQPNSYLTQVKEIAAKVDILLVKPHPAQAESDHISQIITAIPNTHLCTSNIYRILSDINLRHVVGLSSSVLHEASLFGVRTTHLISCDRDEAPLVPAAAKQWYRVRAHEVIDEKLPGALAKGISLSAFLPRRRNKASRAIDLRQNLGWGWSLHEFYSNAPLTLDLPRISASER